MWHGTLCDEIENQILRKNNIVWNTESGIQMNAKEEKDEIAPFNELTQFELIWATAND